MELLKVISALNSGTRLEIFKTLADDPKTVTEVQEGLKQRNIKVKYRETIYRALEKLVDSELVEKYYERNRGLCYKSLMKKITIDLIEGDIINSGS